MISHLDHAFLSFGFQVNSKHSLFPVSEVRQNSSSLILLYRTLSTKNLSLQSYDLTTFRLQMNIPNEEQNIRLSKPATIGFAFLFVLSKQKSSVWGNYKPLIELGLIFTPNSKKAAVIVFPH